MASYILSLDAQWDLGEIRDYYQKKGGARAARHVLREIAAAFRFLAMTPGAGHLRADLTDEPVRFWPVFSYLIVYDPAVQPLGIARVLHGNQDLEATFRKMPPRM